jgi:WD40 repeat protein
VAVLPCNLHARNAAFFTPDGGRQLVAQDRSVAVFDTATWKEVARWPEHEHWLAGMALSHDGRTLATLMQRGFDLSLWDVAQGKLIARLSDGPCREDNTPARAVGFSPDDRRALVVDYSGAMLMWDLEQRKLVQRWKRDEDVVSVAISPDGKHALCGASRKALLFRLPP